MSISQRLTAHEFSGPHPGERPGVVRCNEGLGDQSPQFKRDLVAITDDGEVMRRVPDYAVGQGPD